MDQGPQGPKISGHLDVFFDDGLAVSWLLDIQVLHDNTWQVRSSIRFDPDGQGQRDIRRFPPRAGADLGTLPAAIESGVDELLRSVASLELVDRIRGGLDPTAA